MYKVVFGWLKKGGVPTGAELLALYQLMLPIFKEMHVRRPPVKEVDDRLVQVYPAVYEWWALYSSRPAGYWQGLSRAFPEAKALRDLRNDVKMIVAKLYPPAPKKAKAKAKAKTKAK